MRLCVYYYTKNRRAQDYIGQKNVEWIVCKACQRKIHAGRLGIPAGWYVAS